MPRTSDADQRLMDAATELIWENSYGSTSVDDICKAAGVKKGSFYHFYSSKSELAVAALEADWQKKKPSFDAIFSSTVPALERITNYFEFVVECQTAMQGKCGSVLGCPLVSLGCEVGTQDKAISTKVHEILDQYVKYFDSAIRDAHAQGLIVAPDATTKAKMLFAFFQGTLAQARIRNDPGLLKELRTSALELLGAPPRKAAVG
jgi:TetR/AcrR family transcriptional repressor of nem operon